jgi:hypothetical protein
LVSDGLVAVKPADLDDVLALVPHVREADRLELWAAGATTPEQMLTEAIKDDDVHAGYIDGTVACIFGVMPFGAFDRYANVGIPWLVASATVERHPLPFLRAARARLPQMLRPYSALINFVDGRNTKAIAWLRWMGFTVEPARPYGTLKLPFHRFVLVNPDV